MKNFEELLSDYLIKLSSLRIMGSSEDMIRSVFIKFLTDSFPTISSNDLDLEKTISLVSHSSAAVVKHGFADAIYGDIIFEFKKMLDISSEEIGKEELLKYLLATQNSQMRFGLLTDGETIKAFALQDEKLHLLDTIRLNNSSAEDIRLRLDTYLFHFKGLTPNAHDIGLRFGEKSPVFWASIEKFQDCWSEVLNEHEAQTKFLQWQNLLAIVYGSQVGDDELFLRHSYLVFIARVLAFVTIEQKIPTINDCREILSGNSFEKMGFPNLVEEDFFAWVNSEKINGIIVNWLNDIAIRLGSSYDLSKINEDLLKSLYQELVDPTTRHELGEFYSPDWLAELILIEANYPNKVDLLGIGNSLLDPSCGSGTFLFTAIRLMRLTGISGKELVTYVQNHIAGIDVHPLAIIIAKINIILALGNDLKDYKGTFHLPVYMANSLSLAEKSISGEYVPIVINKDSLAKLKGENTPTKLPGEFRIPIDYQIDSSFIDKAIDLLLDYSHPEISEETAEEGFKRSYERLSSNMPFSFIEKTERYWLPNLHLMRWLQSEPATNGVWKFILKMQLGQNYYAKENFLM